MSFIGGEALARKVSWNTQLRPTAMFAFDFGILPCDFRSTLHVERWVHSPCIGSFRCVCRTADNTLFAPFLCVCVPAHSPRVNQRASLDVPLMTHPAGPSGTGTNLTCDRWDHKVVTRDRDHFSKVEQALSGENTFFAGPTVRRYGMRSPCREPVVSATIARDTNSAAAAAAPGANEACLWFVA